MGDGRKHNRNRVCIRFSKQKAYSSCGGFFSLVFYHRRRSRGHQPSANSITSCERSLPRAAPVVRRTCRSTPLTIIFFLSFCFIIIFFFFLDFEEIAIRALGNRARCYFTRRSFVSRVPGVRSHLVRRAGG